MGQPNKFQVVKYFQVHFWVYSIIVKEVERTLHKKISEFHAGFACASCCDCTLVGFARGNAIFYARQLLDHLQGNQAFKRTLKKCYFGSVSFVFVIHKSFAINEKASSF